jgi:hypothetical protein
MGMDPPLVVHLERAGAGCDNRVASARRCLQPPRGCWRVRVSNPATLPFPDYHQALVFSSHTHATADSRFSTPSIRVQGKFLGHISYLLRTFSGLKKASYCARLALRGSQQTDSCGWSSFSRAIGSQVTDHFTRLDLKDMIDNKAAKLFGEVALE